LEETLLAADVGYELTEELLKDLREIVEEEDLRTGEDLREALKDLLYTILVGEEEGAEEEEMGGLPETDQKPRVILVVGVNGSGKTTSIAKLARLFQREGMSVLLAAGDTFRAAAIEQLQTWGGRVGAEVVAHTQGANPGAVVFDSLEAARTRGKDVVIIDTAGRLHTKSNLMEELKRIHRVINKVLPDARPDVLLVLDATTGQNGLVQAREFTKAVDVDGAILAKLDGTAKGGVIFAIREQLGIPVRFIGTGEGMDDLVPFDPEDFVDTLFDED
jgi:fused signal recognition particle receptor